MGSAIFLTREEINPSNFCPTNRSGHGTTAILIDASDQLTNEQSAALRAEFENLSNPRTSDGRPLLKRGDRLAVYLLEEDYEDLNKIFDMCSPGTVSERELGDRANEGENFAKLRWKRFSQNIMNKVSEPISNASANKTSPIIESIKHIRHTEFPPSDVISDKGNFRLIIASDLLQNSGIANHYSTLPQVRQVFRQKPIDMTGIEVRLWRLNSQTHLKLQSITHLTWWREFFALANARLRKPKQF